MPEGFTDRTAWEAVHWTFAPQGVWTLLDGAMQAWQLSNQARLIAAMDAAADLEGAEG